MRRAVPFVLLFALGCGAPGQENPGGKEKPPPGLAAAEVTVETEALLHREYGGNAVAADQKFTGKVVEVKLVRGTVAKDARGRYLVSSPVVAGADLVGAPGLACYVGKGALAKLESAKPGSAFHLRGRCVGRTDDARAWQGYTVTLEDCEVVAVLEHRGGKWTPAD